MKHLLVPSLSCAAAPDWDLSWVQFNPESPGRCGSNGANVDMGACLFSVNKPPSQQRLSQPSCELAIHQDSGGHRVGA